MAFPPKKKDAAPSKQPAGPPDPFAPENQGLAGGTPQGPDPFAQGSAPGAAPTMPGLPGFAPYQPLGPVPGLDQSMGPKPGQGMDPFQAMNGGLAPPGPSGPPLGPGGLPVGGSLPDPDGDSDALSGGSTLLQGLLGSLQGDPYSQPPGASDQGFQGMGPQDPNMGVQQILQMLALGNMGVGGGAMAGQSGVDVPSFGSMGTMGAY